MDLSQITDYQVAVGAGDYKQLVANVKKLMEEGFQPFGSIALSVEDATVYYAQAMVRYADQE